MSKLCIYHGGCTDGVAAAWAVWKANQDCKFYSGFYQQDRKANQDCKFYPGVYQQDPPWDLINDAAEVVLVDFSYKGPILREIARMANGPVTILDHHKTAQIDLAPLLDDGTVQGAFDMSRCGAMMAWDYFHPDKDRPALLKLIDAQDRWLPERDAATIMALRSYPHKPVDETQWEWDVLMTTWDSLMTIEGLRRLREDGEAIHRYYRARVDETKPHAAPMQIGQYKNVPVLNAPYYLASDVAGELAETAPDGIAAVWWRNKDGTVTFSLRSRGDVDVGVLAVEFGGGGHPGAAGFKLDSLNELMNMCKQ